MEVRPVCGGVVLLLGSNGFIAACRPVNEHSLLNSKARH